VDRAVVLEKAIRPFHYFNEERKRNGNGGDNPPTPPTPTKAVTPPPLPPTPKPTPPASKPALVRVKVSGNTKPCRDVLKEWWLMWDPKAFLWIGEIEDGEFTQFSAEMKNLNLKVEVIK
jgi:hypothetical protein